MDLLHLFTRRTARHKQHARRNTRTLRVESLEDRRLCALPGISYNLATGVLVIQGTPGNDIVGVSYDPQMQKGCVSVEFGGPQKAPGPLPGRPQQDRVLRERRERHLQE
jgi:hypothetical protein